MVTHLRRAGAFGVRMGPPVITGRWSAADIKAGIADDAVRRLTEVAPLERSAVGARVVSQLNETGRRLQAAGGGFAAGTTQYNFAITLSAADGHTSPADHIPNAPNQKQRGNINKTANDSE